jgi:hypothetical protein
LDTKKPAKVKDTTSGFGVNLATFRYAFNWIKLLRISD